MKVPKYTQLHIYSLGILFWYDKTIEKIRIKKMQNSRDWMALLGMGRMPPGRSIQGFSKVFFIQFYFTFLVYFTLFYLTLLLLLTLYRCPHFLPLAHIHSAPDPFPSGHHHIVVCVCSLCHMLFG